jgi:hypothetical protein
MPAPFLARLARSAGYVLTGNAPADWFGPQNPLPPQAVAGRSPKRQLGNLSAARSAFAIAGIDLDMVAFRSRLTYGSSRK